MTEFSLYWSTGTSGDGAAASYTQVDVSTHDAVQAACLGFEGVAPGYLNGLAGTVTGANTAQINTGGAIVDGKAYQNGSAVNVNVPSPVTYNRIDRIVLRASWSAHTVRITRVAGTEAASPTAPAITQTSGTTYDIKLYQALVTPSGTVTLTDERTWANIPTSGIQDAAVTSAKISAGAVSAGKIGTGGVSASGQLAAGVVDTAALANDSVDDTKVGNRVPSLYRRKGGNAGDWSAPGTTVYTPTAVRMQAGSVQVSMIANARESVSVTFPVAFSAAPVVVTGIKAPVSGNLWTTTWISNIDASGVTIEVYRWNEVDPSPYYGAETYDIYWLAIGPE